MWYWPYLFSEIYDVRLSATKTDFFPKNPSLKKALFFNVGVAESFFTDQIYFHWPKKASFVNVGVAESIFTGQI